MSIQRIRELTSKIMSVDDKLAEVQQTDEYKAARAMLEEAQNTIIDLTKDCKKNELIMERDALKKKVLEEVSQTGEIPEGTDIRWGETKSVVIERVFGVLEPEQIIPFVKLSQKNLTELGKLFPKCKKDLKKCLHIEKKAKDITVF